MAVRSGKAGKVTHGPDSTGAVRLDWVAGGTPSFAPMGDLRPPNPAEATALRRAALALQPDATDVECAALERRASLNLPPTAKADECTAAEAANAAAARRRALKLPLSATDPECAAAEWRAAGLAAGSWATEIVTPEKAAAAVAAAVAADEEQASVEEPVYTEAKLAYEFGLESEVGLQEAAQLGVLLEEAIAARLTSPRAVQNMYRSLPETVQNL